MKGLGYTGFGESVLERICSGIASGFEVLKNGTVGIHGDHEEIMGPLTHYVGTTLTNSRIGLLGRLGTGSLGLTSCGLGSTGGERELGL